LFPFAHVGIGTHLIPARVRASLPWRWLALGCLLPDLIDKPIWIAARLASGSLDANEGLLANARLFSHSVFFAGLLALAAALVPAARIRALAYAVPTHLLLDVLTDYGMGGHGVWRAWLFWPFDVPWFAAVSIPPFLRAYAPEASSTVYLAGELVGAALLLWDRARRQL
jgi:membrane-bound metal-dependent hydrolase YbcI (DUF457 family)